MKPNTNNPCSDNRIPAARAGLATPIILLMCLTAGCAQHTAAPQKSYAFWPPFPQDPRILFLTSYAASSDIEPAKTQWDQIVYGTAAKAEASIINPYGVAMRNGRIYVCDTRNSSVEILDLRKHHMEMMGAPLAGELIKPVAIAIAPDGTKYIADTGAGAIAVFDDSDHFVRQIGHQGLYPVGVAVHGNELYVTDYKASHIEVFDRTTGNPIRTIGKLGRKPGELAGPLGITTDDQGNIYVDDIINCRVQKFTDDGKLLGMFGMLGDRPGNFTRPKHIAVDHNGVIYVVDAAFQNVQMFDSHFKPLLFFGNPGDYPGAMDLPAGVSIHDGDLDLYSDMIPDAFQAQYLVLVTNQGNNRKVSVYAFGHLKPGRSVNDLAGSQGVVPPGTTTQPTTGVGAPLPETKN
jgi:DNA-binding beta-propeller fold protein YncE